MKLEFTVKQGNKKLILIFAGWGMDSNPFRNIRLDGHDIAVVWDYRDMTLDITPFAVYSDIYLFAWSFGVYTAARAIAKTTLNPTIKIAVNGSLNPIDDREGIPVSIFRGTLENLSSRNLDKFYRRMCKDSDDFASFNNHRPCRELNELIEELSSIALLATDKTANIMTDWDRAVISENDRIFPIENLRCAWSFLPRTRELPGGAHLPDWQSLIEQEIIDKNLVAQRFSRSATTYDANADVQRHIAERLWSLWQNTTTQPPLSILEAGYGTGILTRLYTSCWHPYRISLWDLAPVEIDIPEAGEIIAGDAEELIRLMPENYYEAIVSASAMQWFDSPERWLRNAARILTPGGIIAVSTFGPDNMREIAEVTQLPLRYYTADELTAMIPDGCSVIVVEEERIIKEFTSPREVLNHLKLTGVNAMRCPAMSARDLIASYPMTDGKARLTYHPIYLIIKKDTNE